MIAILCVRMTPEIKADAKKMAVLNRMGAKTRPCHMCGHPVVTSPESRRLIEDGISLPRCHECNESVPGLQIPIMTVGQVEELDHLHRHDPSNN